MIKFSICNSCGRFIDEKFMYCPWCGFSVSEKVSEHKIEQEKIDRMFDKLEEMQNQSIKKKIIAMEQKLDALEDELTVLVLNAEIHK